MRLSQFAFFLVVEILCRKTWVHPCWWECWWEKKCWWQENHLVRSKCSWWEKSSTGEKKVQLVRKKFSWWKISPTYISITNNELNLNIDIEYWYYMDHIEWSILNSQFTQTRPEISAWTQGYFFTLEIQLCILNRSYLVNFMHIWIYSMRKIITTKQFLSFYFSRFSKNYVFEKNCEIRIIL